MTNFLLPLAVALLGFGGWRFYKNRAALSNVVILVAGLLTLLVWAAVVTDTQSLLTLMGILVLVVGLFSIPVLIAVLLLNGLVMFQKEARTLGNMLSLLVGLLILFMCWSFLRIFEGGLPNQFLAWMWMAAAAILAYVAVAFVVFLLASALYKSVPAKIAPKYGIVLGARLIDGKPPTLLRSRLDKAMEVMRELDAQGIHMTLIPTGGQGRDEVVPEGVGMAEYLVENDVPKERIIIEDRATNTHQNLVYSRELMESENSSCVVFTNSFHVFRTAMLARKIGLKTYVYGSKTRFYYLPSAVIREFIAIMMQYKWLNVLVVAVLLAISFSGFLDGIRN